MGICGSGAATAIDARRGEFEAWSAGPSDRNHALFCQSGGLPWRVFLPWREKLRLAPSLPSHWL